MVDAHVRERLIWLRQQQEDMTILLSQVSTACLHCEKTLQQVGNAMPVQNAPSTAAFGSVTPGVTQDDCRVVLAKQEISCLLETLQKQQHQFTELADHIQLDAGIPVTFTKVGALLPHILALQLQSRSMSTLSVPGQPGPHRSQDGDPRCDSGSGWSRKNHHPLQTQTRRVHAADPDDW